MPFRKGKKSKGLSHSALNKPDTVTWITKKKKTKKSPQTIKSDNTN